MATRGMGHRMMRLLELRAVTETSEVGSKRLAERFDRSPIDNGASTGSYPEQDRLPDLGHMKIANLFTMGIVLFAFIYEAVTYNAIFLGKILPAAGRTVLAFPLALLFNATWFMALWSYFQAHLSDPGRVPEQWRDFVRTVGEALPVTPAKAEWQPGQATFCKKCMSPRPERAHHCLVCGLCVLRMDHHCPWINNCVGFGNHKFFLLLGIYTSAACCLAFLSALPDLVVCVIAILDRQNGAVCHEEVLGFGHVIAFFVFGALASTVGGLIVHMLTVHIPLACRNSTSIEDCYENMTNPFDQGSAWGNVSQIFGAYGPDWFFPVRPARPLCDGIAFASGDEERLSLTASREREPTTEVLSFEDTETKQIWRTRYQVKSRGMTDVQGGEPALPSLRDLLGCGMGGRRHNPLKVCEYKP